MSEKDSTRLGTGDMAARVLREVLRTPAFRELIRIHLAPGRDGGELRPLIQTLIWEDVELPLSLAATGPRTLQAALESALALGEELGRLPPGLLDAALDQVAADLDSGRLAELPRVWAPVLHRSLPHAAAALARAGLALLQAVQDLPAAQRARLVQDLLARLDGEQLGQALNAAAMLVQQLRLESPKLLDGELARQLVQATDFGKVRLAAEALSAWAQDALLALVSKAADDPAALANLMLILPQVASDLLRVLAGSLESLKLPDEMLASAILNLLQEVDMAAAGRAANRFAELLGCLHHGSQVLGGNEPAFAAVLAEVLDRMLAQVDDDKMARALLALGEDAEVVASELFRRLARDPASLIRAADTAGTLANLLCRALVQSLGEIHQAPAEVLSQAMRSAADGLDAREVARLADSILSLLERSAVEHGSSDMDRQGPRLLPALLAGVDRSRLLRVLGRLGRSVAQDLAADSGLRSALAPEEVGRRINAGLRWLGRSMTVSSPGGSYLLRVLAAVDLEELVAAWSHGLELVARTVLGSRRGARALVRPATAMTLRALRLARRRTRASEGVAP